jgi:hypothetical protein
MRSRGCIRCQRSRSDSGDENRSASKIVVSVGVTFWTLVLLVVVLRVPSRYALVTVGVKLQCLALGMEQARVGSMVAVRTIIEVLAVLVWFKINTEVNYGKGTEEKASTYPTVPGCETPGVPRQDALRGAPNHHARLVPKRLLRPVCHDCERTDSSRRPRARYRRLPAAGRERSWGNRTMQNGGAVRSPCAKAKERAMTTSDKVVLLSFVLGSILFVIGASRLLGFTGFLLATGVACYVLAFLEMATRNRT